VRSRNAVTDSAVYEQAHDRRIVDTDTSL
jgi:hypothetical protein